MQKRQFQWRTETAPTYVISRILLLQLWHSFYTCATVPQRAPVIPEVLTEYFCTQENVPYTKYLPMHSIRADAVRLAPPICPIRRKRFRSLGCPALYMRKHGYHLLEQSF